MSKRQAVDEPRRRQQAKHEVYATRVPLDPLVLYDLDRFLDAWVIDDMHTFAAFRGLATSWRVTDLFYTQRKGVRTPPQHESYQAYASLLFAAIVRRATQSDLNTSLTRQVTISRQLGAVYLLLLLHETQPYQPRVPIPILEDQCLAFERLREELRSTKNADGFKALHMLWDEGDRLEHLAGKWPTYNTIDKRMEEKAEREAQQLAREHNKDTLAPKAGHKGSSYAAERLRRDLPSLYEAEAAYETALESLLEGLGDAAPPLEPAPAVAPAVQRELLQYHSLTPWPEPLPRSAIDEALGQGASAEAAAAPSAAQISGASSSQRGEAADDRPDAAHARRQATRERSYAPDQRASQRKRKGLAA